MITSSIKIRFSSTVREIKEAIHPDVCISSGERDNAINRSDINWCLKKILLQKIN